MNLAHIQWFVLLGFFIYMSDRLVEGEETGMNGSYEGWELREVMMKLSPIAQEINGQYR